MPRYVLVEVETDLPQSVLLNEFQRTLHQLQFSTCFDLQVCRLTETGGFDIRPCDE